MTRRLVYLLLLVFLAGSGVLFWTGRSDSKPSSVKTQEVGAGGSVVRDKHGKIKRSSSAIRAFKKLHPCPANGNIKGKCPGYVIDHIIALKRGGADDPSNMQWQTIEEGKAKDKWE